MTNSSYDTTDLATEVAPDTVPASSDADAAKRGEDGGTAEPSDQQTPSAADVPADGAEAAPTEATEGVTTPAGRRRTQRPRPGAKNHTELKSQIDRQADTIASSKFSIPHIEHKATFNTLQAQRSFATLWRPVASALYNIDVIMSFTKSEVDADAVSTVIDTDIANVMKGYRDYISRLEILAANDGLDANNIGYKNAVPATVNISSPSAFSFLHCIEAMDRAIQIQDLLWLHRAITRQARREELLSMPRKLSGLAGRIVGISRRSRDAVERRRDSAELIENLQPIEEMNDPDADAASNATASGRGTKRRAQVA